jgi:uncharacterized membrane protein
MQARREILEWAGQGRIAGAGVRRALEIGGVLPRAEQWRLFLDRLCLFLGAALLGAGAIFFIAFNWDELGRYGKFALAQAPIIIALAAAWQLGLDRVSGKAAIFFAALSLGALLALIGQTYQTGADTYELFAVWAAAILPWALVARFPALWVLWLALVNLAASLYHQTFHGVFGMLFGPERLLWLLFAINTAALFAWETCARLSMPWLAERWAPRLIALAGGITITWLALGAVMHDNTSPWTLAAWFGWIAALYFAYRRLVKDLFMLAGGALSAIVLLTAGFVRAMPMREAAVFLFIGLAVIGMSAAAGWWLRQVAREFGE